MSHTIYVLVLSMILGGSQGPVVDMKAISSHWSMSKCQEAAQEHRARIGPNRPRGSQIGCLVVEGKISY